jgi:glutamate carboxypeptidase
MPVLKSELDSVRQFLKQNQDSLVSAIRETVEVESPSGNPAGITAVVEILTRLIGETRSSPIVQRIPVAGYGEHLLARFGTAPIDGQNSVLLLGHTDTVHPIGTISERPWKIEGDKAYGPGVFDMKANCVLSIYALRALEVTGVSMQSPVTLLLTCDEEIGSMSGRAFVESESRRSGNVLGLEPPAPGGIVKTGRKGTGLFTLEARGVAAHAGLEPEKGANAILEIARQILRVTELSEPSLGTTINVGVVGGGTRSNVVPESARIEVDVRFSSSGEAERIENQLKSLMPFDTRVRLNVTGGINRPPLERTEYSQELFHRARDISKEIGFELKETQVGGASDGNFAAACGARVLDGLGVDGDGAHASHEHILISDLVTRGTLLAGLLASL